MDVVLVPKLRLGTQKQQALACFIRKARAFKAAFPSGAWERVYNECTGASVLMDVVLVPKLRLGMRGF